MDTLSAYEVAGAGGELDSAGSLPAGPGATEDLSSDDTIFAGFLFKRGLRALPGREAGYKRRFFVLSPGRLSYYHSWEDHELRQRAINSARPMCVSAHHRRHHRRRQ